MFAKKSGAVRKGLQVVALLASIWMANLATVRTAHAQDVAPTDGPDDVWILSWHGQYDEVESKNLPTF
jgi:hypothetical protein